MKIILNLPKSATALASMMLADSVEQEQIDAAIEKCEEAPVEIDMKEFAEKSGSDSSDIQALNLGLALIALAKVSESNKQNYEKQNKQLVHSQDSL